MINFISRERYKMRQYHQYVTIAKVKYAKAKVKFLICGDNCKSEKTK
jgi:hypothetical protein